MLSVPNRPSCAGITRAGARCGSPAVSRDGWCYVHDPGRQAERDAARKRGGHHSARHVRAERLLPTELAPIFQLLRSVVVKVYQGEMPPAQAAACATVASAMCRIYTAALLQAEVAQLEAEVDALALGRGRRRQRGA